MYENIPDLSLQAQKTFHGGPDPSAEAADYMRGLRPEVAANALRLEISPLHQTAHLEHARANHVPNVDTMSVDEQNNIGEVLEIGEEALARSMEAGSQAPEQIGLTTFGVELTQKRTEAREIAQSAIERLEVVATPEVTSAVEGYYVDHVTLAEVIKGAVHGDISPSDSAAILDGSLDSECVAITMRIRDLANLSLQSQRNPDDMVKTGELLRSAENMVRTVLFQEVSLGATTLDDELARQTIADCAATIHTQALKQGAAKEYNGTIRWAPDAQGNSPAMTSSLYELADPNYIDNRMLGVAGANKTFWHDSRQAGQLEFHNTPLLGNAAQENWILASRASQAAKTGTFKANTNVLPQLTQHTNQIHFAEKFDAYGYREKDGKSGGTIAMPLAEIIQQLPYAREAHYAVLESKDSARTIEKVTLVSGTGDIGSGRPDTVGEGGMDRVFYASATDPVAAVMKDIKFGGREYFGPYHDASDSKTPVSYIIRTKQDFASRNPADIGSGQHYPENRNLGWYAGPIDRSKTDEIASAVLPTVEFADEKSHLDEYMKNLQEEVLSLPLYRGKIVGALRSGVFSFDNESGTVVRGQRDRFLDYERQNGHSSRLSPSAVTAAQIDRNGRAVALAS